MDILNNKKINLANKIIFCAKNFSGEVFGGYVRNVIVPRKVDPKCDVYFDDVNIWFQNFETAEYFKSYFFQQFYIERNKCYDSKKFEYPFEKEQFAIFEDAENLKFLFHVDIVISETLPVNDFDVNCLLSCHLDDSNTLYDSIKNKTATMLAGYLNKANPIMCRNRIIRIFFDQGWIVKCSDLHDKNQMNIWFNASNIISYVKGNYICYKNNDIKDNHIKHDIKNDEDEILFLVFKQGLSVIRDRYTIKVGDNNKLKTVCELGLKELNDEFIKLLERK